MQMVLIATQQYVYFFIQILDVYSSTTSIDETTNQDSSVNGETTHAIQAAEITSDGSIGGNANYYAAGGAAVSCVVVVASVFYFRRGNSATAQFATNQLENNEIMNRGYEGIFQFMNP